MPNSHLPMRRQTRSRWRVRRTAATNPSKSIKMSAFTSANLPPKGKINQPLAEQRHAWVQLIEGDLDLNGKKLSPGDGASLDDEKEIRLASAKGAHFLLFDLN